MLGPKKTSSHLPKKSFPYHGQKKQVVVYDAYWHTRAHAGFWATSVLQKLKIKIRELQRVTQMMAD